MKIVQLKISKAKRIQKSDLTIELEILIEADKELVVVKKTTKHKILKQIKLIDKKSRDVLSFDSIELTFISFKKILVRTDKLKTQISLIESISEDVERQNKKLIDR
jgi:hypothetical protein